MKKLENKLKSTEDQLRSTKRKLENQDTQWPRGKGGKGAGKRDKATGRAPPEMHGKATRTKDNEPICFGFNLQGCNLAQLGLRCPKG